MNSIDSLEYKCPLCGHTDRPFQAQLHFVECMNNAINNGTITMAERRVYESNLSKFISSFRVATRKQFPSNYVKQIVIDPPLNTQS